VRREPEVVAGFPDRLLPVNDEAAEVLKKRTLTNLYNSRHAWVDAAHARLDAAVADAYGWGEDWRAGRLDDDAILARLFALNKLRAGGKGSVTFSDTEADLLQELEASGVKFVIVGGAAVVLHGCDRKRKDLDILIWPEVDNLDKLIGVRAGTHVIKKQDVEGWKERGGAMQVLGVDLLKETLSQE
jgi:hypothetical protein